LLTFVLCGCADQPKLSPVSQNATILAFGDSLTFGTGVSARHSYPAVLSSISGRKVLRSGVPGEISGIGLERLRKLLPEVKPDLVILCHGGNDILRRMSRSATEANLRQMIKTVREHGAQVIVIAVPKLGLFPEAQDYYELIQADLKVPVEFDIIADLERDRSMKSDQIHFNSAGYRRMAEAINEMLIETGAFQAE
jgi:lysophospholipase L1-like esterase